METVSATLSSFSRKKILRQPGTRSEEVAVDGEDDDCQPVRGEDGGYAVIHYACEHISCEEDDHRVAIHILQGVDGDVSSAESVCEVGEDEHGAAQGEGESDIGEIAQATRSGLDKGLC